MAQFSEATLRNQRAYDARIGRGGPRNPLYSSYVENPPPPKRYSAYIRETEEVDQERAGDGRIGRQDNGRWRPMLTHTSVCPACEHWVNVAVLGKLARGVYRLNCQECGYLWIHRTADSPNPLLAGYDGALHRQHMGPTNTGYVEPERGV